LAALESGAVPITITITTGSITGTLTGTFTASLTLLAQILVGTTTASGPATVTITSGTGGFAGTTGSFNATASGTGTGTTTSGAGTFMITGPGTLTISGGGTTGPAAPTITGILNNYSLVPKGAPNYGIAPGALFIVQGTGMADATAQAVLQSSAAPGIPKTLNGASISVTVNGTTVTPGIYYAIANQLAAVLPNGTPTGTGTITVSYNNTPSATFPIQVVPAALGLGVYNGSVIATNPTTGSLYTATNSAKPGDIIVLWGSGLGGITADSDTVFTSTPHAAPITPQIYIGGIPASVYYAGDSGYPGVNQIDVTIPAAVAVGCNVSLVAVSGSGSTLTASNATSIAIAAAEGAVCSDPTFGTNGTTFTTLSGQTNVKTGVVILEQSISASGTTNVAESVFEEVTGLTYTGSNSQPSLGSCAVTQTVLANVSTTTTTALNTGTITISGPNGSATLTPENIGIGSSAVGLSFAQLASGFIPSSGGAFTFSAPAGTNVGSFSVTLNFPNPLLSWTNTAADASISRASGVTVNWNGGAPGTYVTIGGSSSSATAGISASFSCTAPVSAGTFTVPNAILLTLPAGTGTLSVGNSTNFQSFTATGVDFATAFGATNQSISATYN
jgi:uncharacterized protein (TIGR03437 family)